MTRTSCWDHHSCKTQKKAALIRLFAPPPQSIFFSFMICLSPEEDSYEVSGVIKQNNSDIDSHGNVSGHSAAWLYIYFCIFLFLGAQLFFDCYKCNNYFIFFQVNFSEGGPGSNSTGSEVASMSSQLPDTPNSMVASPIEAWRTFTQISVVVVSALALTSVGESGKMIALGLWNLVGKSI